MITPQPDQDCTRYWTLDRTGLLRFHPETPRHAPDHGPSVASGSITPVAASGWINLPRTAAQTLEARALDALHLTEVLERLDARFPGYRWFVRECSARAA